MKTKHTPGNWIVANSGGTVIVHNGTRYTAICELEKIPLKITPEIEANAALIAAAPDLLQMVYDLKNCIKRLTADRVSQENRDKEAQWIGEAHELLLKVNPDYSNANTKETEQPTDVIFLMEKPEGNLPCNVFAFFPKNHYYHDQDHEFKTTFTCYAHLGQHSSCHIDYANKCKEATPEQFAGLKIELESIGYSLNVITRQAQLFNEGKETTNV